jgi:hypothetical protein
MSNHTSQAPDFYINHEVRIQMLEQASKDIKNLLRWLVGIGITSVVIPILLHKYGMS